MRKAFAIFAGLFALGLGVAVAAPKGSKDAASILSRTRRALNTPENWYSTPAPPVCACPIGGHRLRSGTGLYGYHHFGTSFRAIPGFTEKVVQLT